MKNWLMWGAAVTHTTLIMRLPGQQRRLLEGLIGLIEDLRERTEGFKQYQEAQQLWYDRGYADGMYEALRALGYGPYLQEKGLDASRPPEGSQLSLPWGKAYRHGTEIGDAEARQIIAQAPA
jgi:hypothetical protein